MRTRWFAVTPAGLVGMPNGTQYNQLISLETNAGAVNWASLVGGTILRTILDFTLQPEFTYDPALPETVTMTMHGGLFVDASPNPSSTMWDPNRPYGSFMTRQTRTLWWTRATNAAMGSVTWLGDMGALHVDTDVKRRIGEGDQLFWAFRGFYGDTQGLAPVLLTAGWTGRVLVRLP